MSVREERPGDDAEGVGAVITAAFGDEGEAVAALWADVAAGEHHRASLAATGSDGQVVGHLGLSHAWVDARRRLVDVWLLSPLSVDPDHQGRGHGGRLLETAVETARSAGAPYLLLEGDPGFYGSRGWVPAATYGLLPPSDHVPPPACQAVRLDTAEDWTTGRAVYPEMWWRHDSVGLRDPLLAQIEEAR